MKTFKHTILVLVLWLPGAMLAVEDGIELKLVEQGLTTTDISSATSMLGLTFVAFDYELEFDYCIRFHIKVTDPNGLENRQPYGSCACGEGGEYRLIVTTRIEDENVRFKFATRNRTSGQHGSTSPPPISIGKSYGGGGGPVAATELKWNTRTPLIDQSFVHYDATTRKRTGKTKVLVEMELLEHPDRLSSFGACP